MTKVLQSISARSARCESRTADEGRHVVCCPTSGVATEEGTSCMAIERRLPIGAAARRGSPLSSLGPALPGGSMSCWRPARQSELISSKPRSMVTAPALFRVFKPATATASASTASGPSPTPRRASSPRARTARRRSSTRARSRGPTRDWRGVALRGPGHLRDARRHLHAARAPGPRPTRELPELADARHHACSR